MKPFNLTQLVRPNILELEPYRCARDDYSEGILLDANESSYFLLEGELNRYPDPYQVSVKQRLMELHKINMKNLFLGVGSDEVIDLLMRVFCIPGKDKVLICPPTYGMYKVAAKINDVQVVRVNLNGQFQLDVNKILELIKEDEKVNIKLMFLCSPGNPTGTLLDKQDIIKILESDYKGIVVIDEAYIDFVDSEFSCLDLLDSYPNLVIMHTLSKAFSLAGVRLGIAYSSMQIIKLLNATKAPYNISSLSIQAATKALSSDNVIKKQVNVQSIISERKRMYNSIISMKAVNQILGKLNANFLLVQFKNKEGVVSSDTAKDIYKFLADQLQVIIRYRGDEVLCQGCLRITIGTKEENDILLSALEKAIDAVL